MKNEALLKVFNLVAATREEKFLHSSFNPLTQGKVDELQKAISIALETKEVKEKLPLTEALLRASGAIDKYNEMPATCVATIHDCSKTWPFQETGTISYQNVANGERPLVLKKMQRKLYKTLKSEIK